MAQPATEVIGWPVSFFPEEAKRRGGKMAIEDAAAWATIPGPTDAIGSFAEARGVRVH
ncbi:MAG: hypothetical protein AVDCRST_MAG02-2048 [uncultured Rubrobacteraceae bacterium]|uniref:Uncharacterized protein n=1 Tax=uncultured Rubrobacteraceae bacterium TaxID=349277 RepID=A0A6J4RAP7_9ACTN|nr:MAG: hypothetical protein AVDCRST_MAG02-2048 [uncultured Rubrobacteraceae bacterium]